MLPSGGQVKILQHIYLVLFPYGYVRILQPVICTVIFVTDTHANFYRCFVFLNLHFQTVTGASEYSVSEESNPLPDSHASFYCCFFLIHTSTILLNTFKTTEGARWGSSNITVMSVVNV